MGPIGGRQPFLPNTSLYGANTTVERPYEQVGSIRISLRASIILSYNTSTKKYTYRHKYAPIVDIRMTDAMTTFRALPMVQIGLGTSPRIVQVDCTSKYLKYLLYINQNRRFKYNYNGKQFGILAMIWPYFLQNIFN